VRPETLTSRFLIGVVSRSPRRVGKGDRALNTPTRSAPFSGLNDTRGTRRGRSGAVLRADRQGRGQGVLAVGDAFDSDTAVGMMPNAHLHRRFASIFAIVIHRQEVVPMNAVSAVGATLQSTKSRD
jgi:hypothetical protein